MNSPCFLLQVSSKWYQLCTYQSFHTSWYFSWRTSKTSSFQNKVSPFWMYQKTSTFIRRSILTKRRVSQWPKLLGSSLWTFCNLVERWMFILVCWSFWKTWIQVCWNSWTIFQKKMANFDNWWMEIFWWKPLDWCKSGKYHVSRFQWNKRWWPSFEIEITT